MNITRAQVQQYGASLNNLAKRLRQLSETATTLGDVTGGIELRSWASRAADMARQVDVEQAQMAKLPKRGAHPTNGDV